MKPLLTALVYMIVAAYPALADTPVQKDVDPSHGSTAPAAGVSPPTSKTVVPEIPANKKPDMETVNPSDASNGAGSGTSGAGDNSPAADPAKPRSE